jgi:Asp/Glu/hydantoin racemase
MTPTRIALIHATPLAIDPIKQAIAQHWPEVQCQHLLDESLSQDLVRDGRLTPAMTQRFVTLARYCQDAGAQGILFTCSAFGPAIEAAGHATGLPTFKPNEAMFEQALALAQRDPVLRVGLVATFEASIASMTDEFMSLARERNVQAQVTGCFVPEAMSDLAHGQAQLHHDKVAKAVAGLTACDVILLAQFSMAAAQPQAQRTTSTPVLSSPDCAILALQHTLHHD